MYYHSVGEAGVFTATGEMPVMTTLSDPAILPGAAGVTACLGSCHAVPTAPYEIDCRAALNLTATVQAQQTMDIVTKVTQTAERPGEGCCCIYFAREGDTAWEVGRKYGLSPAALAGLNPQMADPLVAGERMTLYKPLTV